MMQHTRSHKRSVYSGFTLLEMTVAILIGLLIASAGMGMLSQQLAFTRFLQQHEFLLDEAPQLESMLGRILSKSDAYRIYIDRSAAVEESQAVTSEGRALMMAFRDPNNVYRYAMISFDETEDGVELGFYNRSALGVWPTEPEWVLTRRASDIEFFIENGILRVRVTGPSQESVIYSGHIQS